MNITIFDVYISHQYEQDIQHMTYETSIYNRPLYVYQNSISIYE